LLLLTEVFDYFVLGLERFVTRVFLVEDNALYLDFVHDPAHGRLAPLPFCAILISPTGATLQVKAGMSRMANNSKGKQTATRPKSVDDFKSVARRLGCDEDKGRFEAKLKKIAKPKPSGKKHAP
ncbi:MAG TPA: hypothetical protein VG672_08730, partial [Bryobacteraceae bacterium]|nr:hypothetical protein [Bryobacteraceae bacterium]